jgi:NhaP-type Na+/H+ or K+/H+ antiporter
VLLLGEISLAIVLFTDAARTNLSTLRQNEQFPLRQLGIRMPLTIVLGTVFAALVLTDLTFWEAAIVGAVLAETPETSHRARCTWRLDHERTLERPGWWKNRHR